MDITSNMRIVISFILKRLFVFGDVNRCARCSTDLRLKFIKRLLAANDVSVHSITKIIEKGKQN